MFGRSESAQIRTLLRLIEDQQRLIESLHLMVERMASGRPPLPVFEETYQEEEPETYVSALDGLPPNYSEEALGPEPL